MQPTTEPRVSVERVYERRVGEPLPDKVIPLLCVSRLYQLRFGSIISHPLAQRRQQLTGLTTVQFQNKLKIDKAKDLIISRSCNITEAAEAVGFSDVYYFSRMFRKITGKNPSELL